MNLPPAYRDRRRRFLILGALWLFIFIVLIAFRGVMLPFATAALIAFLIAPAVNRLSQLSIRGRHLPRWVALLLVYAGFFLVVYLFLITAVPQLYRELARISKDAVDWANSLTPQRIRELSRSVEEWLNARGVPVAFASGEDEAPPPGMGLSVNLEVAMRQAVGRVSSLFKENLGNILTVSRNIITSVLAGVFMTFFMLMVAAFFSLDFQAIRSYCRTLIPPEYDADAKVLVKRIERSLAGVVRGQVTICLVNGTLTFVGLILFGVRFAFLLATIATLFSLIPIFGTILSSVPIVLIGLSQSWKQGFAMLLWIIGIHALEAYFLNPKIMGSAARIHPVVVAFALLAGEHFYGLIGALFAVPLAAIAVACFDFARQKAQPQPGGPAEAVEPPPPAP